MSEQELAIDIYVEIFTDLLEEQGEVVFSVYQNAGVLAPAEDSCVRKFRDLYRADTRYAEGELTGPYDCLLKALEAEDPDESLLLTVGNANEMTVRSSELSAEEVVRWIRVFDDDPETEVTVNGELWIPDGKGRLVRAPETLGN